MIGLKISPQLSLPLDAITETFALLAVRRAGKSNAAVVMAEEMYDNGLPWVAVDPKGDWWGVRAAGDGKAPGLAVLVFGGLHGDVPLEPTAGKLVADLIVEQRLTCVLDVSEMSKADMRRFLTDFALRLYQRNTEPLHVFCEEADEYIPQRVMGPDATLVGAFEKLIKRGGFRGIGVTLITQRSASLNKDVLTQVGTLIPMRTPSPQDRKAILAWVDVHDAGKEAVEDLPSLDSGEAYVFSPQWLNTLTKIKFRRRRTFDSGATPKVGQKVRPPATLADVDLASLKEAMAETIEKQKADDPSVLRKRILELEREAAKAPVAPEPVIERVEVPILTDDDLEKLVATYDRLSLAYTEWAEQLAQATDLTNEIIEQTNSMRAVIKHYSQPAPPPSRSFSPSATPRVARPATPRTESSAHGGDLTGPQQKILDALAWLATVGIAPASRIQVGMVAGYHPRTKGFTNGLGTLSTGGYVTYPQPGYVALTDAGTAAANAPESAPSTDQLQQMIYDQVGNARARILREVVDVYPEAISRPELAARLDYHERTKGFTNALGALRTLGLIDYPTPGMVEATDILFLNGGRS